MVKKNNKKRHSKKRRNISVHKFEEERLLLHKIVLDYNIKEDEFLMEAHVMIADRPIDIKGVIAPEALPDGIHVHSTEKKSKFLDLGITKKHMPLTYQYIRDWVDSIGDYLDNGYLLSDSQLHKEIYSPLYVKDDSFAQNFPISLS